MDVSVIIINYNTFELTCQCIQSVIEKTNLVQYEIVLVDNGSTEQKPEDFITRFPKINLVKSKKNLGFAKGNNLGIQYAEGKFILLLNSDIKLINNGVKIAIDEFERTKNAGALSGQLFYSSGKPQPVAGRFPSIKRELFDMFRLSMFLSKKQRANYYLGTEADYNFFIDADWIWGAFFLFQKELLLELPGNKLQDDFFMYFEDLQWCYYIKKSLKKRIVYSPKPQAYHYIGSSSSDQVNLQDKYLQNILPNEYKWMKSTKGSWYAMLYYLIKGVHLLSTNRNSEVQKGKIYLDVAFKGL